MTPCESEPEDMRLLGTITMPGVPRSAQVARAFVSVVATHVDDEALSDVVLCVDELVANACEHTASGTGGQVTVVVSAREDVLRVTVLDQGGVQKQPRVRTDPFAEDGRGPVPRRCALQELGVASRVERHCRMGGIPRGAGRERQRWVMSARTFSVTAGNFQRYPPAMAVRLETGGCILGGTSNLAMMVQGQQGTAVRKGTRMIVRPAEPADLPTLAPLWRTAWHDGHDGHVPEALMDARGPDHFAVRAQEYIGSTLVATDADGRILGLIILGDDDGEVIQLAVDASARGQGIGGTLLRSAEERFRGRHREAWLAVVPGNTRARRMYEFHGWRDTGPITYQAPTATGTVDVPVHRYVKDLM